MRPKTPETTEQPDTFRETPRVILNLRDELLVLARPVRLAHFDFGYGQNGVRRNGFNVVVSHTRGTASPSVRREMRQ